MVRHPMVTRTHLGIGALAAVAVGVAVGGCEMATLGGTGPVLPTRLTFTLEPEYATAGSPIGPGVAVSILDNNGDTAFYVTATIQLSIVEGTGTAGASIGGVTAVAVANGTALFAGASIDSAGTGYRLLASAPGLGNAFSDAFDVTPGVPARLAFLRSPGGAVAGDSISPAVQVMVEDEVGNVTPLATDTVTLAIGANPGGGALTGTTLRPVVSGVATFPGLAISTAGAGYTLVASAPGRASATSSPFTIAARSGAQENMRSGRLRRAGALSLRRLPGDHP